MKVFRSILFLPKRISISSIRCTGTLPAPNGFEKIGAREVVGYGTNGQPTYIDDAAFPFPAVRFREITPEFKALREKEKGDWKSLTLDEKKCLYRISFCQTLVECDAPTGDWKLALGTSLLILSACIWFHLFIVLMIKDELPETYKEDRQLAQLRRIIDLRINPVTGISSHWDYEKDAWKPDAPKIYSYK